MKRSRLVDALVVLSLAGALLAVSARAWWDHQNRARVAEALRLAASARDVVAANAARGAPHLGAGYDGAPPSEAVRSIRIDDTTGRIVIDVVMQQVPAELHRLVIQPFSQGAPLAAGTPAPRIEWRCDPDRSTLPQQFRPEHCR